MTDSSTKLISEQPVLSYETWFSPVCLLSSGLPPSPEPSKPARGCHDKQRLPMLWVTVETAPGKPSVNTPETLILQRHTRKQLQVVETQFLMYSPVKHRGRSRAGICTKTCLNALMAPSFLSSQDCRVSWEPKDYGSASS